MKAAAVLVVLASFGLLAGGAQADLVPVPTVPAVPVPAPPVAVPLPTIPKLPAPAVPQPVKSAAPAPAPVHVSTPSPLSPSGGSGAPSSSSGSSSSSSGSSSAPQQRPRVTHFNSSRPWIGTSGPKRRRTTTLTFFLPRAARVIFVVRQVSPACLTVGRFAVHGHAGLNRVRFAGRLHGERLGAGTYKISARTAGGRAVRHVTVVIVEGSAPTKAELAAARGSNACTGTRGSASTSNNLTGASNSAALAATATVQQVPPSAIGATKGSNTHSGAVLASTVEKTARAIRPALVALLGAAILLLGLASLPRAAVAGPRVSELLAQHRLEIAGVGAAAFVAVVIVVLLA